MKFYSLLIKLLQGWKKSLKFRQSKGNNSSITDDNQKKLHIHNHTIVIYIQYKSNVSPSKGYRVMAEDAKQSLKFRQTKGNSSAILNERPIKLYVHNLTIVIYIQYKWS